MRREAFEGNPDAEDFAELRRELRVQKDANRELADVVARQSQSLSNLIAACEQACLRIPDFTSRANLRQATDEAKKGGAK